ncbi:MAG TPA: hypothetical protein VFV67_12195 [Actinophytocola sp.]|uniref:hypothetical protein n=1 Tax=Actinophytocola sp. TaxID=1872138 RepID=UPI002DB712F5|nr:hypothetical protein [Actinophytocola sp.]HEU5471406.1 hypothetical protein [Actinophytocola sp.]
MTVCFLVGGVAGWVARSRWAVLVAPAAFAVACEIGRIGVVGPSVDRPDLSARIGVLVFVVGGGFQAVVQLVPMMLGAAGERAWPGEPRPDTANRLGGTG